MKPKPKPISETWWYLLDPNNSAIMRIYSRPSASARKRAHWKDYGWRMAKLRVTEVVPKTRTKRKANL